MEMQIKHLDQCSLQKVGCRQHGILHWCHQPYRLHYKPGEHIQGVAINYRLLSDVHQLPFGLVGARWLCHPCRFDLQNVLRALVFVSTTAHRLMGYMELGLRPGQEIFLYSYQNYNIIRKLTQWKCKLTTMIL